MSTPETPNTNRPTDTAVKKPVTGTEYVVLRFDVGSGDWAEVGETLFRATSAQAAVHEAIGNSPAASGTYVAVPARSWKPVKVTVETVSRVKLESA